jgi:hypothetical protein
MAGRLAARPFWGCTKKLTFMTRCSLIRNWLQECRANHTDCLAGPSLEIKLPVRLIDIGQSLGHISMSLVSVTELDSPRYVALSHCWGDPSLVLSTTRAKVAEFNHHINIGALPQTFRDAVAITQAINVRYLWIDSLCIVQDDPDEWAQEAEKMASIFQNAYLTVCAAGARSCKEGCGVSTQFSPAVHVDIPSTAKENSRDSRNAAGLRQLCVRRRGWRQVLEHCVAVRQFPIHSRGWIFQETLLSRRVIYFTPESQFYWQCCSLFESEDGILHSGIPDNTVPSSAERLCEPSDRFDKLQNDELAPNIWNEWMRDYFAREFSVKQDRLPALAGATALYQKITGDVPVIGMWKRHLPLQLGWRVRCLRLNDSQLKPPRYGQKDASFPSWSFFSIKHHGAVELRTSRRQANSEYMFDFECDPVWEAGILDIQVTWTGKPLVSALREGIITTRTIIRPFHGTHGATNWQIAFDSGEVGTLVSPVNLYFLLLRVGKYLDQLSFFQLLIQPCGRQQHTYRRVGYLETSCMIQDAERLEIQWGDVEFRSNREITTFEKLMELDQEVIRLI